MTSLLNEAVEAHGGLARWNGITGLEAELSITGAIWHVKSKPDFFKNVTLRAATQKQHVVLSPVGASGRHTVFQDDTLALKTAAGEVLERRKNPESSYVDQTLQTPWDDLHGAFFATSALWTYFTAPFLYTYPGFRTEEVEPRHENGEVWRGLQVTFPEHVRSHTRHQTSYFGPDGLLRRHDYTVDLLGGATGANYALDFKDFDGIKVPTKRRIWAYDENRDKVPEPLLVAVDVLSLRFT
ncbi:hypothetical protein ACWC3X_43120 [Streptomyces populi]|jgi:hypothetical protein